MQTNRLQTREPSPNLASQYITNDIDKPIGINKIIAKIINAKTPKIILKMQEK